VRDGVRLLPQEVSKLRYEDLRQILVDHYREHYPSAIKDSINWRRKKGHKDATIRRQLTPLRSAFQRAKDLDRLTDNHIPSFVLPRDSEPREGFLEPEDFNLILERLPVHLKPAAMFMYFTGARKGSVKKVTWSMVSKDNTQITMPGRINKNRKPHVIPLVGPLEPIVNMLAEMRKSFPRPEDHVFDFTNHRNIWNQVCAELGFGQYDKKTRKYTGLLMHDFRRSAARNLLKMGVRKELAKRITGHLTDEMSDRYAIQTTDDVREALIKVGKYRPETAARSSGL